MQERSPKREKVSLKDYSYFATGGGCSEFFAPKTTLELAQIIEKLSEEDKPYFLLGGGTNSLVSDEPWPHAVISFHELSHLKVVQNTIQAGAGATNSAISTLAKEHGLLGAHWMFRLPGQIGATCRMNARCYGGEISEIVSHIVVVTPAGEILRYGPDEGVRQKFISYKNTDFMTSGEIIAEIEITLTKGGDPLAIAEKMQAIEDDRNGKHQFSFPSCGCVFKNDYRPEVSVPSGLLLDLAGAMGVKEGKAEISPYHCNFIFNKGAGSRDIVLLCDRMRELVYSKFGVWLDFEMELLGKFPKDLEEILAKKKAPMFKHSELEKARAIFHKKTTTEK